MDSEQIVAFEEDASQTLRNIWAGIAALLAELPEVCRRPSGVAKLLRIPQTLAWRVTQVASGKDLYSIPQILPGERALNRFLHAAAHGASDITVERIWPLFVGTKGSPAYAKAFR